MFQVSGSVFLVSDLRFRVEDFGVRVSGLVFDV